jgi:REP-associated tyrosine transposase
MRNRYKILDDDNFYFISSSIVNWIPVFTSEKYFNVLLNSMKYCQKHRSLKIYYYVIMDNHFHMIVYGDQLEKTISVLKRFTALEIVNNLKKDSDVRILELFKKLKKTYKSQSEHQVWQEGYHPQLISDENMLFQKRDYIHYNPVKRGFVNQPEHWRYSSACNEDVEGNKLVDLDDINEL